MTAVDDNSAAGHLGDLALRRFRAGEFAGPEAEAIGQHTARCAQCRNRLAAIEEEQRGFERAIPFERFAGGVERAARVPAPAAGGQRRSAWRSIWILPVLSLAAAFVLVVRGRPAEMPDGVPGHNQRKGAAVDALVRIASADGKAQRELIADGNEQLGHGDRLRIGYETDHPRHLVALSIDDHGVVTAIYPDTGAALTGASLRVDRTTSFAYLPGSIELTGAGHERLFLLLADGPFSVESAVTAVRASRTAAAAGGLAAMSTAAAVQALDALSPRVFTWLLDKP